MENMLLMQKILQTRCEQDQQEIIGRGCGKKDPIHLNFAAS